MLIHESVGVHPSSPDGMPALALELDIVGLGSKPGLVTLDAAEPHL
jgi:hypothetical protein